MGAFLNRLVNRPAPVQQQTQEDPLLKKAEEWMNERWSKFKMAFTTYHASIWECFLMYAGQTWIEYDAHAKVFTPQKPADDFTPQPRINRFSPAIDSVASNFSQVPEVEAVPSPPDNDDAISVANIADKLCKYAIKENALRADFKNQEDKAGEAGQLFVLAGSVFTGVYPEQKKIGEKPAVDLVPMAGVLCRTCNQYDKVQPEMAPQACPQCGGPVEVNQVEDQVPRMDPETGQPVMEPVMEWQVRCRVGNPICAVWRPGATGMYNTPYFLWAERTPLREIKKEFGVDATADTEYVDGFNSNYESSLNYFYTGYSSRDANLNDAAMLVRIFIEPDPTDADFPEGLYAAYCNGKIIHAEPWPFVEHPMTKADYMQLPTLFQGRSIAFELAQLQKEYQSYESIIKLHGMTSAVEPIIIDENTVVNQITGRADKIIRWRSIGPGSKEPHRMAHGSLDDGIYKQRQSLRDEFENVSGSVSVFKGQQPGSITAASAIAQLKGQAEQMFSKPVQNWNALWKETVRKIVKNYQKYYSVAQLAQILGEDCIPLIPAFKKADLDKMVEFVATQNGLPRTREEKKQEMLMLFDRGALDVNDPNVRQKVFELFGETGMMKAFNADASRARWENKQFQQNGGQQVVFMPMIEDLAVHDAIHCEAIKSLEFNNWTPEAQRAMIAHATQTKQAKMAMQAVQAGPAPAEEENTKPPEVKDE